MICGREYDFKLYLVEENGSVIDVLNRDPNVSKMSTFWTPGCSVSLASYYDPKFKSVRPGFRSKNW